MKPAPLTYNWLARQLHWFMAALILFIFLLGLTMTALPLSETRLEMITWHKWVGMTILALAVVRLLWRLATPHPSLTNPAIPPLMEQAAKLGHFALYLLLFIVPLLGWAYSSAAGFEVNLFQMIRLPDLVAKDKALAETLALLHEIAAWSLMALVAGHILAALIHHIRYDDPVIRRMKPNWLHILTLGAAIAFGTALLLTYRVVQPVDEVASERSTENKAETEAKEPPLTSKKQAAEQPGKSNWQILLDESQLDFTATQKDAATTGSFELYQLTSLTFNKEQPEQAAVNVEVDIASLSLGNTLIEQTLLTKGWFNVKEHPKATFTAKSFKPEGADRYQMNGELTINGITKPLLVTLTITEQPGEEGSRRLKAEGSATISRTAYGIGDGEWASTDTLKDEVSLKISITATNTKN